jgi:hypothetical protein
MDLSECNPVVSNPVPEAGEGLHRTSDQ